VYELYGLTEEETKIVEEEKEYATGTSVIYKFAQVNNASGSILNLMIATGQLKVKVRYS